MTAPALDSKTIFEIEIPRYSVKYKSDGVLYWRVKNVGTWNLEDFTLVLLKITNALNGKKVPVLLSFENNAIPGMRALDFWSTEKLISDCFIADAIILNSTMLRVVVDYYLRIKNPMRPTKIFEKEETAALWLQNFRQEGLAKH